MWTRGVWAGVLGRGSRRRADAPFLGQWSIHFGGLRWCGGEGCAEGKLLQVNALDLVRPRLDSVAEGRSEIGLRVRAFTSWLDPFLNHLS